SLGETIASAALVAELRLGLPGMRLLLTHGTATGRARGASLLEPGDAQVWQPWDTPAAVEAFLQHFKPSIGLLMETEVWPSLVAGCQRRGVPLCLVNARLSDKSLRQAQRLAWLARPAYCALHAVWAQSPADAQRLQSLGAPVQGVFGNLKFDLQPNIDQLALGRAWRQRVGQPVVCLAISREGEEAMLLEILRTLQLDAKSASEAMDSAGAAPETIANQVQWMVVPRHPQRWEEVASLAESMGFAVLRRSQWGRSGPPDHRPVLWLGDSMGEMALYYGLSDIALLGGSFAPLGGQNLIEALACGCPVVMGPHTFNFAQAAELACAASAGWQVADMGLAVTQALALLRAPDARAAAVHAATGFARANQGAALHTARAVQALLAQVAEK
ncbi:MAG: 3-deoxy-D-manno-octulosonic acid transferase, partial [Burkholderiales bacterium PBB4]